MSSSPRFRWRFISVAAFAAWEIEAVRNEQLTSIPLALHLGRGIRRMEK